MDVLTKAYFSFTQSFRNGSIVEKKEGKKQLLSVTTIKTLERPGKIKKCIREDVYIRPWSLYYIFWTYIYVHGIQRVKRQICKNFIKNAFSRPSGLSPSGLSPSGPTGAEASSETVGPRDRGFLRGHNHWEDQSGNNIFSSKKAPGPDGFKPIVLKNLNEKSAIFLTELGQLIFEWVGVFWKFLQGSN